MKVVFTAKAQPKPMRTLLLQSAQGKKNILGNCFCCVTGWRNKSAVPTTEM